MLWYIITLAVIVGNIRCHGEITQTYTLPDEHSHFFKIHISDGQVFIGGRNVLVHLNSSLRHIQTDVIGPVNNSMSCKPFDQSCIYAKYDSVDNDVSLLVPYKSYLIVCGTSHQGLCYRYNKSNIHIKNHFKLEKQNFLGSNNSSVMVASKIGDTNVFFVGQSYDGRNGAYFNKEFITLDVNEFGDSWSFDMWAAASSLSVCSSKRNSFKLKFLYIFETDDYIHHVFLRSMNKSGHLVYETRISSICKNKYSFSSYEEMAISCQNPKKYDIGLAAHFDGHQLLMTFGVRAHRLGLFEADATKGSVLCTYTANELMQKFNSEVLSECYRGDSSLGTPSWLCDDRFKSCEAGGVPNEKNKVILSCNQTKMPNGIESTGEGYSNTASYTSVDELMTAVYPLGNLSTNGVVVGTNRGYIGKVLIPSSRMYARFDVSQNPDIRVNQEMALDRENNLYVLTGNKVTKLSMTSCQLHLSCGQCVTSEDPLGCGWCYSKCLTQRECSQHSWHHQSCPPFIHQIKPSKGPLDGGTRLVIFGENFGNNSHAITTKIGGYICKTQTCNNSMITCTTGNVTTEASEHVQVTVSTTSYKRYFINGTSEQNNVTYQYKALSIEHVYPVKGPLSGNVLVTLIGENLDIGSNTSVNFGSVNCHITSVNASVITCRTQFCSDCTESHDSSICLYRGRITLQVDYTQTSPRHNGTFCFTHDPKVIQPLSRSSSIISGGIDIEVPGSWFDSVSSQVMQFNIKGERINTSCEALKSGSLLVCPIPDLSSITNTTLDVERSLLFNGIPSYTDIMMIYPDPVLDKLRKSSNIKYIDINDKVLELKGEMLSLSLKKDDYSVKINGSKCNVTELSMTYLRCNLSSTVHIQNIPLPVEVSAGSNWKSKIGHIKFEHVEYSRYKKLIIPVAVVLSIFVICIAIVVVVMKSKHLGMFRKKITDWSIAYHPETRDQEDNNENVNRYVRPEDQERKPFIDGATGGENLKTAFDACEITDMLKQQNIYIERDLVELGEDIGHGNFGCVYKGYLLNKGEKKTVAVKTILKAGSQDVNSFLDEAMIMKDFVHPNVLSLIGISVASGEFPLVILPFMANGDLLSYIRNEENKPTVKDLVKFGLDVGRGMEYLGTIKFVHRDLAARNCMLDEEQTAKVADFGLARDIYTKNYYSSDNKKMLPVKWMAPESLENGTYGIKSDVWSFGVVMWELMTRGAAPYADVDNWDMLNYLQSGRRLKRPNFCPPQLYEIMLGCWEFEAENRPSFTVINQRITELFES